MNGATWCFIQSVNTSGTVLFSCHYDEPTLGVVVGDPCERALRGMGLSEDELLRLKRRDAWDEYLKAKHAVMASMRASRFDSEIRKRQERRLRDAIDLRAARNPVWRLD